MKLVAPIAFAVALLVAQTARGDDPESARRHFADGTKYYNVGDFAHAAEEYKQAYLAAPNPALLYNAAQAYRLAGDLDNALMFYRSYLRASPKAPNRVEVEGRIKKAEADLRATNKPAPDALPPSPSTAATTEVPKSSVVTTSPGPKRVTSDVMAESPGTSTTTAPATTRQHGVLATTAPSRHDRPAYKKPWVWIIVGVAAVGAGLGIGFGISAAHSSAPVSQFGTIKLF